MPREESPQTRFSFMARYIQCVTRLADLIQVRRSPLHETLHPSVEVEIIT